MKKIFFITATLVTVVSGRAQKVVNFETELNRLHNINVLPVYMEGTRVKQISSYDRTGGNDDGFSGKYSFIKKEKDDLVIFDVQGSGVIERIWTPTPTHDTLDFYFDGSPKPGLSLKFSDLFSGDLEPFLKPLVDAYMVGGYYSYVPIPYSKSCKIVFRGEKIMFHQIQYREYNQSYRVETFDVVKSAEQKRVLRKVTGLWSNKNRTIDNFKSPGIRVMETDINCYQATQKQLPG